MKTERGVAVSDVGLSTVTGMALIISKDDEPRKVCSARAAVALAKARAKPNGSTITGICFSGILIRLTLARAENDAGRGKGKSGARTVA